MMFVDANVFMYAVGRPHPLREEARQFFLDHPANTLVTSAEVLQELDILVINQYLSFLP